MEAPDLGQDIYPQALIEPLPGSLCFRPILLTRGLVTALLALYWTGLLFQQMALTFQ